MLLTALLTIALAQDPSLQPTHAPPGDTRPINSVSATKTTQALKIDGKNEEAVWKAAPVTSSFRQFEPHVDANPAFRTEFQVAFDTHNLYAFVRMRDPHPDSILHALSRRDVRGPSDQIKLIIDSYDDKRTGFEFAVNPDGVKRDFSISDDGNENDSWNGVWDVATSVDAEGWTAEFRIPLSQLRYGGGDKHTFGFGVWRDIERLAEREAWPAYSPTKSGLASQLGRLDGIDGISTARRVELTPYIVAKNLQRTPQPNTYERNQQFTAGADLKLGITPNITLDATMNPDFGQVEADPAVLNLTAFETFQSERRPFFVAGTGLYQFQLNCYIVVDCSTNEGLFYSRRIGRSPSLRGRYGDALTATSTPIALATKLTGRTGSGLSFGLLDAVTQEVQGVSKQMVEPQTNYAVLRGQQDFRGAEAGLSLIGTAVNRSLDTLSDPYLNKSAFALGTSFRNRFHNKQYEIAGSATASQINGTPQAILIAQRSPVHYFQQPGDDYTVDTTRTSLSGHAEQLKFGKYSGGITRFETSIVRQSAGFEVNDIGFLRRADFVNWSTWGALSFRNARGIYRWAQVNGNHWEAWTTSGKRTDNAVNFNGHMGLKNSWDVHLGGTYAGITPTYCDRCTRGGPLLRRSATFAPWGGFNSDSRKSIAGGLWVNLSRSDERKSASSSFSPYLTFRMSTRFQANIGPNISFDKYAAQWYGNFTDAASVTHYSFAKLNQRTVSMSTRLNYTATPTLTFEFYGQPFVASAKYSNVREISATPEAARFDDRYQSFVAPAGTPTMQKFTQLRTNSVARWEFRPGSTLFVVWAHGRTDDTNRNPDQSWARDYRDLFALHPDNTFLVKMAYWLNR
ncbi:MAG: DUF5916 domain-containing protein [Gemmatimonas sp.]